MFRALAKEIGPPNASVASLVFMPGNYKHAYCPVNKHACFTQNKPAYIVKDMNYAQRIRAAREHAGLSQKALADAAGISQSNISQLENINSANSGSAFTAQIAHACGVSAIWLATGEGQMLVTYAIDQRAQHVLQVMEKLPEEFREQAVRTVDSLAELSATVTKKTA